MSRANSYAAMSANTPLVPFSFSRREVGPRDVQLTILFCGVCHSDLHKVRGEWPNLAFPMVPGHEIVGKVTQVGEAVTTFKPGDIVAVGCMVDSCQTCDSCASGLEHLCDNFDITFTYNSKDKRSPGSMTFGGYSTHMVVDQRFVFRVPSNLDLAGTAPLLCAGITMYSPLRRHNIGKGKKVGIVGLGGLGHMGVKFSHAMAAHTVLFTTSEAKIQDAKRLGADEVILSRNEAELKKHANSFDLILNTVAASHNLDAFMPLLKRDSTLCLVGVPDRPHPSPSVANLIFRRRQIAGTFIGGTVETQEMLGFCSQHNIVSDVEIIPIQKVDEAFERMLKNDVKYRFVIDNSSLA
jgi:alcohol dehydrogenase (NADP+)